MGKESGNGNGTGENTKNENGPMEKNGSEAETQSQPKSQSLANNNTDGSFTGENLDVITFMIYRLLLSSGMSRSQIRRQLIEETGGSIEELKKRQSQLKSRAHSGIGTPIDKKALSVCSDVIKTLHKQSSQKGEEFDKKDILPVDTPLVPPTTAAHNSDPPTSEPSLIDKQPAQSKPSSKRKRRREEASTRIVEIVEKVPSTKTPQKSQNKMEDLRRRVPNSSDSSNAVISGPTVVIRPNVTAPAVPHPPLMNAVPHTSFPINTPHQVMPHPQPRPQIPVPLLPSPPPQYAPLMGVPPPSIPPQVSNQRSALFNHPLPLAPGFSSHHMPPRPLISPPSLLPHPPPVVPRPHWYPPSGENMQ